MAEVPRSSLPLADLKERSFPLHGGRPAPDTEVPRSSLPLAEVPRSGLEAYETQADQRMGTLSAGAWTRESRPGRPLCVV